MNASDLKPGIVVRGPMLPEPRRDTRCHASWRRREADRSGPEDGAGPPARPSSSAVGKRFIVEEGVGKQPQFWKLAQSLSTLYPSGTDEKRWVDGVLTRKKGLGF